MEFLTFLLFAICIAIMLFKPEKEGLVFGVFLTGTAICFIMFAIASWTSFLPYGSY